MPLYNGFLSHLIWGKQKKTHVEFESWAWIYWLTRSSKLNGAPFFKHSSSIKRSSTSSALTIALAIFNDCLHFQSRSQRKTAKLCARASHDGAVIINLIVWAKSSKIIEKIFAFNHWTKWNERSKPAKYPPPSLNYDNWRSDRGTKIIIDDQKFEQIDDCWPDLRGFANWWQTFYLRFDFVFSTAGAIVAIREDFMKILAVFLDFVQMRWGEGLPNFLSPFHKCKMPIIWSLNCFLGCILTHKASILPLFKKNFG